MVKIDGINLPKAWRHLTINGGHISATHSINGATDIRHPNEAIWWDEKHAAVMKALCELEKAVEQLLGD